MYFVNLEKFSMLLKSVKEEGVVQICLKILYIFKM